MTAFEGMVVVILMVLSIGLVVIGASLWRIEKTLKARGLASPHVIVTTRDGGIMKGMQLDVSGPGYGGDPGLEVLEETAKYKVGCVVTNNTFNMGGGVKLPKMKPVEKVDEH